MMYFNSAVAGVPVVHSSLRSTALIAMEWESMVLENWDAIGAGYSRAD